MATEEAKSMLEEEIDRHVDAVLVMPEADTPPMDDLALQGFVDDIARKIDPPEVIQVRYGFTTSTAMVDYMRARPEVLRRIKQRRAIWESNGSIQDRAREYAGVMVVEGMHKIGGIMLTESASHAAKIDAFKATARVAGVDGAPAEKGGGPAGTQFVVHFNLGDRVETLTATPIVEPDAS